MQDKCLLLVAPLVRLFHQHGPVSQSGANVLASITETLQHPLVIRPARFDAHPYFEEDLAAKKTFHIAPRAGGDFLHLRAAFSEQNRALACLVDIDGGVDSAKASRVLEAVDGDRRRIRHFFAQQAKNLLANILRSEKALVAIRKVVSGVERRTLG